MTHPKNTKISEAVKAAVFNVFSTEFHSEAIDTLSRYGLEMHEREPDRVKLAIVNLCGGSMGKLDALVIEAKKDYRNILHWDLQASK